MPKRTVRQRVRDALHTNGTPPTPLEPSQRQVHDTVAAYRRRREAADQRRGPHRRAIIHTKKAPSAFELSAGISLPVEVARTRMTEPRVLAEESKQRLS